MLKMATLSLNTDFHSLFERLNDSFAKMLVNIPGILKDILFQLLQSCWFVSVNTVFEMSPEEKVTWIEIRWVWWPLKRFLEADHISSKFVPYPASRGSSCVCRRTVLLKPLAFEVHISTPQRCREFLHDCQDRLEVTVICNTEINFCRPNCAMFFKDAFIQNDKQKRMPCQVNTVWRMSTIFLQKLFHKLNISCLKF